MAYALERKSEHPLAKAIVRYAEERHISSQEVDDYETHPGSGVSAVLKEDTLYGGNLKVSRTKAHIPDTAQQIAEELARQGKTRSSSAKMAHSSA